MNEERAEFLRYDDAKRINAELFDHTNGSSPGYSQRLNGTANEKYGLAKSLSVMPGDTIRMKVYAKYVDTNTSNWNIALTNLMTQIANNATGVVYEGTTYGTSTATFPYAGVLSTSSAGLGPKAFLNYLMFDKDFNPILTDPTQTNFVQIKEAAKETGNNVQHDSLMATVVVNQPGYLYIYLSNDNPTPVEVFFDDFTVTHTQSPVVQSDNYYPFGLTFYSYSRENSTMNNYLFNGIEKQDELDLGWDLAEFRSYSPEIGRWHQIDPKVSERESGYVGFANNPILYADPLGDTIEVKFGGFLGFGRKTVNVDENGGITNKDGSNYVGKVSGFLKKVTGAISELSSGSSSANGWLKELSGSDNLFTIKRGNGRNEFVEDNIANAYAWMGKGQIGGVDNTQNGGSGGTIFWSPSGGNVLTTSGLDNNPTTNLAHELLGHGLDANRGEMNTHLGEGGLSRDELQASYVENIVRSEMGLNMRTHYRREGSTGKAPYLLDSKTNIRLSPQQPPGFKPLISYGWYRAYIR